MMTTVTPTGAPEDSRYYLVTAQGDNWAEYPTRASCGSCHDDVVWETHRGGQSDDSRCGSCHSSDSGIGAINAHRLLAQEARETLSAEVESVSNSAPGQAPTVTFRITNPDTGESYDILNDPIFAASDGARLAVGLAPESLDAFFVQRSRWAQGALQILYLKEGPLGPGLNLAQRIMFMPTHWLTQSLMQVTALLLPVAYLIFGFVPMVLDDFTDLFNYQMPAIFASIMTLRRLAPDAYFAVPSTVLATLQSFRFLPMLLKTLVKPHGHKFQVTPKGSNASGTTYDSFTLKMCLILLWGTTFGFLSAMWAGTTGDGARQLYPIVSIWSVVNGLILAGVLMVAFSKRVPRAEERFFLKTSLQVRHRDGTRDVARTLDVSMSGVRVAGLDLRPRTWLTLQLPGVPPLLSCVRWHRDGMSGIEFLDLGETAKNDLIACIYTDCDDTIPTQDDPQNMLTGLLYSIFARPSDNTRTRKSAELKAPSEIKEWYADLLDSPDPEQAWHDDLREDQHSGRFQKRPA